MATISIDIREKAQSHQKDTPTSKAKHLVSAANNAEAIAQRLEEYGDFRVRRLPETYKGLRFFEVADADY
ncbi:hypothetical protein [Nostoc sp. CCY0012]|uniref:hypothetical protein n=1 Tax=Nostoc sp. CCY0012 TaxID=1056123 RepID=UPI0039C5BF01